MKIIGSENIQQKFFSSDAMFCLKRKHYSALLKWIKKECNAFTSSSLIGI